MRSDKVASLTGNDKDTRRRRLLNLGHTPERVDEILKPKRKPRAKKPAPAKDDS